jgi:hypothetical protein
MASLPPGECWTAGVKHEGTPKGSIEKIGNSETPGSGLVEGFVHLGTFY